MPELSELALESPQLKPAVEELPEFTAQTLKKLQARPLGITPQKPSLEDVSRPMFEYADSEELTRAILHYEILGRPLSVRDPSQRIIGL
jgi:hypothetical protein